MIAAQVSSDGRMVADGRDIFTSEIQPLRSHEYARDGHWYIVQEGQTPNPGGSSIDFLILASWSTITGVRLIIVVQWNPIRQRWEPLVPDLVSLEILGRYVETLNIPTLL